METTEATIAADAPKLKEEQNRTKMLSNQLATYKAEKNKLKLALSEVEKKIDDLDYQLREYMQAEDLEKFSTSRGTFYINRATRARVVDPDLAFSYMKDLEIDGLIKPTVNANSLSSDVKRLIEEGKTDLTALKEHGIDVYVDESVKILGLKEE